MRVLVVTSCTSAKQASDERQLTRDDFLKGPAHVAAREESLSELLLPAEEMYTGEQHMRLMRGVRVARGSATVRFDLWVLSAGYGLVPGDRALAPYECTFQGMKSKALREWADELNVPAQFRALAASEYDLGLVLLGDAYLAACDVDARVQFGGPTLLFCGAGAATRLPNHPRLKVTTLANPEAKRFSCPLVALKGELAARILTHLVARTTSISQLADPAYDVLGAVSGPKDTPRPVAQTRKKAVPNPAVDRVISLPDNWLRLPHRTKFRFFLPEWDDRVDPDFDFAKDEHSHGASDWSNAMYAHQLFPTPNYDGLLVSRVVAEKGREKKFRINALGVHRFLRVPREFPVMGDCGAFDYVAEEKPPYTTEDVIDYYTRLGFDYGVSVDHMIVPATESASQFRYALTIHNAEEFLTAHRKARLPWQPIGAVQGWDPQSYANAAATYVTMGYKYIALGGLVRSPDRGILATIRRVRAVIPKETRLHVFGVARPALLRSFADLGVNSADSASVLRQAWTRTKDSYHADGTSYAALRIPQAGSFRVKRMKSRASLDGAALARLEADALRAVRGYAERQCSLEAALSALLAYDRHVTAGRDDMTPLYRRTLEASPWERCGCAICQRHGVEVVIFRGNNRNRRRGFHNTFVFYEQLQRVLAGEAAPARESGATAEGPSLLDMLDEAEPADPT